MLRALSLGGARLGPADRGSFWDCGWRGLLLSGELPAAMCLHWRICARNWQQKSRPKAAILCNGASDRARTGDPRFTRAVLYQLSYAGGHVVTQLRRQRLSMIRDITNPRKCSDGFSHFKCTNIGGVMSCSYGSQAEWGSDGSTQDPSHAYR